MSLMSDVGTGTLGWVKAEIDGTIAEARACLSTDVVGDDTPLRMLANHVHQLVGTLQMIDLPGPAMFATEAEALVEQMHGGQLNSSGAALLDELFATLSDYLGALEGGAPDVPLQYLELLNRLRTARAADALDPADLFTVDLTVYPSSHRPSRDVSDADYQKKVKELRSAYQDRLQDIFRAAKETRRPTNELADELARKLIAAAK